jgi:biopolymer transport protein ExbD
MRAIAIGLALAAFSAVPALRAQDSVQTPKSRPIVATVNRDRGKLKIAVEPNLATNGDLLRAFGQLLEQRGRDYPVVVLVDDDSKLSDIYQAPMLASKAGFLNIHVFLVNHKTRFLTEIKVGLPLPLSDNPPLNSGPFRPPLGSTPD